MQISFTLQQLEVVSTGTIIQKQGIICLILESMIEEGLIQAKNPSVRYDKLVCLRKSPRDPRHHSKIDYGKLKEMMTS